jgi:hypothetical protein
VAKETEFHEADHTTKKPVSTTPGGLQPEFFCPAADENGNRIFSGRCHYRSRDGPSEDVQAAPNYPDINHKSHPAAEAAEKCGQGRLRFL